MSIEAAPSPATARIVVGSMRLANMEVIPPALRSAADADAPIYVLDESGDVLDVPNLLEPWSWLLERSTGEEKARVEHMMQAIKTYPEVRQHFVDGATKDWARWFGYWRRGKSLAMGEESRVESGDDTWDELTNLTSGSDPSGQIRLRYQGSKVIPGEYNRRIVEKLRPDLGEAPSGTYNDAHESVKAEMLARAGSLAPIAISMTTRLWTVDSTAQVIQGEEESQYEFTWRCPQSVP